MSIAYLVGVVEDGSKRGPYVPVNVRKTLRAYKGARLVVRLAVVTPGGEPVDLTDSHVYLTVKRRSWDDESVVRLEGEIVDVGRADLTIPGSATRELRPGGYVYDVWWVAADGSAECVVPIGAFHLEPSVAIYEETLPTKPVDLTAEQLLRLALNVPVVAKG